MKNSELEVLSARQVKKSAFTRYFPKITASGATFQFNDPLIQYKIPGGNLPVYDGNPANLATPTEFAYFPGISLSLLNRGTVGSATAVQPLLRAADHSWQSTGSSRSGSKQREKDTFGK